MGGGDFERVMSPQTAAPVPIGREQWSPGPLTWRTAWGGLWAWSVLPRHRFLEAKLTPGRDDGQAALKMVVDEVTDAVEDPVLRPDL